MANVLELRSIKTGRKSTVKQQITTYSLTGPIFTIQYISCCNEEENYVEEKTSKLLRCRYVKCSAMKYVEMT